MRFFRVLLFLFIIVGIKPGFSQNYLGMSGSNYSGIHGMYNNPAVIVDSRYQMDINIFSMGFFAGSNYLSQTAFSGTQELKTENKKFAYLNIDLRGPGAYYTINQKTPFSKTSRISIGLETRMRIALSINNMSRRTMSLLYNGLSDTTLHHITFMDDDFKLNFLAWRELGFVIGGQVFNKNDHVLNAAVTIKRLYGVGAAFINNNGARFQVYNHDSIQVNRVDNAEYGHQLTNFFNAKGRFGFDHYEDVAKGYGYDFGLVYEYRPGVYSGSYQSRYANDLNKYKFKVQLSLLDVGGINFSKDAKRFIYKGDNQITRKEFDSLKNPDQADVLIHRKYQQVNASNSFTMKLPTSLFVQVDYNVNNLYYVNAGFIKGFAHDANPGVKQANYLFVTPRIEKSNFELAVPISFLDIRELQMGFLTRLGCFGFGSDSILNMLKLSTSTADFYFVFRIPIYRK